MSELKAGSGLDAAVGKAMGAEPNLSWNVLNADETASCYHDLSRAHCQSWMDDLLKRMPDSWVKDYHVGAWEFWPKYSADAVASTEVKRWLLTRARKLGCSSLQVTSISAEQGGVWAAIRRPLADEHVDVHCVFGTTEPEAIALLALAVAQEQPR